MICTIQKVKSKSLTHRNAYRQIEEYTDTNIHVFVHVYEEIAEFKWEENHRLGDKR